jgi:hypothetical protein
VLLAPHADESWQAPTLGGIDGAQEGMCRHQAAIFWQVSAQRLGLTARRLFPV